MKRATVMWLMKFGPNSKNKDVTIYMTLSLSLSFMSTAAPLQQGRCDKQLSSEPVLIVAAPRVMILAAPKSNNDY